MLIRKFEDKDTSEIERMSEQIVAAGDVFPFESVQGVLDYWFSPGANVFVAESGDIAEADGSLAATYVIKPIFPDRCAHVANAGYMVDSGLRGRGIGSAIGTHSVEIAASLGFRSMQFSFVVASNEPAIRLWKKLGFETVGRVPRAFRHDELGFVDLIVMSLDLGGEQAFDAAGQKMSNFAPD